MSSSAGAMMMSNSNNNTSSGGGSSMPTAVALSNKSEEFKRVKYLLQLSLRDKPLKDLHIWHFSNGHLASRFEQRTHGAQCLHTWIGAHELDPSNTLESLHSRGFTFPPSGQGMLFHAGNLQLDRDGSAEDISHRYILSSVGVGRSILLDDINAPRVLPKGYDSLFVSRSVMTGGGGKKAATQLRSTKAAMASDYHHDYIVLDPSQVLPLYLVQFSIGQQRRDDFSTEIRIAPGDALGPMSPAIQQLYDRCDFFDPILYVPVSVRDKMVGSHSTGEAAQHKLIGIGDAYDAALAESMKPDPLVAQRQAEIRSHLSSIEGKIRDVNRNAAEVEERIYQVLQDALFQLQDLTKEKINVLLAEEVEAQRQLQYVDWVESFLDQQREVAAPVDFLNSWKCHVQLRADVAKAPLHTPQIIAKVHADLVLKGSVSVVKEGSDDLLGVTDDVTAHAPAANLVDHHDHQLLQTHGKTADESNLDFDASSIQLPSINSRSRGKSGITGGVGGGGKKPSVSQSKNMAISQDEWSQAILDSFNTATTTTATAAPRLLQPQQNNFSEIPTSPPPQKSSRKSTAGSMRDQMVSFGERTPPAFLKFSLSEEAARRLRQRKLQVLPEVDGYFKESRLISKALMNPNAVNRAQKEIDDSRIASVPSNSEIPPVPTFSPFLNMTEIHAVLYALPFSDPLNVEPKLIYASYRDARSVEALLKSIPVSKGSDANGREVEFLDDIPTVLLIKSGNQVFGGYASQPWRTDGQGFGTSRCFLFSLTKDIKIPFHGRKTLPPSPETVKYCKDNGIQPPKMSVLISDATRMQFGPGDLVIESNFQNCSSDLEQSFGFGLAPGSSDALTFLAGSQVFNIDEIELWGLYES